MEALPPAIQRAVWSVNPDVPIMRVRAMQSFVAASAGNRRFALLAIETLAIVSLLLAGLGAVIGLGGAWAASRLLTTMLFGVHALDPVTYGGVIALLAAVALLAAWAPALRALRIDPTLALRPE